MSRFGHTSSNKKMKCFKMGGINWSEMFPTKYSTIVFFLYIALFVNQGILVTASQESNNVYKYDIVYVVLLTEMIKLIVSVGLYCKDHSPFGLLAEIFDNRTIWMLYMIPALLYCFYNNLSFINLSTFDPTTYYLLLQFRVVITAVLFQVIFNKSLSKKQWVSLIILTIGCMIKQINFFPANDADGKNHTKDSGITKSSGVAFDISALLILLQATFSCLAGVYNEYILKKPGADLNIYVQNVLMYIDSIFCNLILLLFQGKIMNIASPSYFEEVLQFKVCLVMLNNAAIGIITSFFLKNLNSILKTFASALELIFTAILSYVFFNIPIYLNTVLAIVTVLYAMFLYSQNPVSNPVSEKGHRSREEVNLLEEV